VLKQVTGMTDVGTFASSLILLLVFLSILSALDLWWRCSSK
jgi:hypothetical protein